MALGGSRFPRACSQPHHQPGCLRIHGSSLQRRLLYRQTLRWGQPPCIGVWSIGWQLRWNRLSMTRPLPAQRHGERGRKQRCKQRCISTSVLYKTHGMVWSQTVARTVAHTEFRPAKALVQKRALAFSIPTITTHGRLRLHPAAPRDLQHWSPPQVMGVVLLQETHGVLACTLDQILLPRQAAAWRGLPLKRGVSKATQRFRLRDTSRRHAAIAIRCSRLPPSGKSRIPTAPDADRWGRLGRMAQQVQRPDHRSTR